MIRMTSEQARIILMQVECFLHTLGECMAAFGNGSEPIDVLVGSIQSRAGLLEKVRHHYIEPDSKSENVGGEK